MQALLDLYDYSITIGNETVQLTCCLTNWTLTAINVPCGQGMSCIGQCTAKDAFLCPSGVCGDCERGLRFDEEEDSTRTRQSASVTRPSHSISWCPRYGCRVNFWPICCYHPVCKKKKNVPQQCLSLSILFGKHLITEYNELPGR